MRWFGRAPVRLRQRCTPQALTDCSQGEQSWHRFTTASAFLRDGGWDRS
jgi:hypothetical protein